MNSFCKRFNELELRKITGYLILGDFQKTYAIFNKGFFAQSKGTVQKFLISQFTIDFTEKNLDCLTRKLKTNENDFIVALVK